MASFADSLFSVACKSLGFDPQTIFDQLTKESSTLVINRYLFATDRPKENHTLAGAITMHEIYRQAPLTVHGYAELFRERFLPEVYTFLSQHADELQSLVSFERDFELTLFSAKTWIHTYLAKLDEKTLPKEIPQFALLRVAAGLFCDEGLETVKDYYNYLSQRIIVPSTPTLLNLGFRKGAPTSCMLFSMGDDLEDIYDVLKEAALASKNNAGLGIDLQHLRHSRIGYQGKGKGIIPVAKIIDDTVSYVDQGGQRPGAGTISIRDWHMDLLEFIQLTKKTGHEKTRVDTLNTSIFWSHLFWMREKADQDWTLFCPKQAKELLPLYGPAFEAKYVELEDLAKKWARYQTYEKLVFLGEDRPSDTKELYEELVREFEGKPIPRQLDTKTVKARQILLEVAEMQGSSGMPYMNHGCRVNLRNPMPNVGTIKSANLCQEIFLPAIPGKHTASCNLASLSLRTFVKDGRFQFPLLVKAVRMTVRALNKVIDRSVNVSEKVKASNKESRPIGIGVSGFAEMLYELDLTIMEGKKVNPVVDQLNWEIWSCMYHSYLTETIEEAKRRGPCPAFVGSRIWEGKLQYHLVQEENKLYGFNFPYRLEPASPQVWGEEGTWEDKIKDGQTYGFSNLTGLSVQPTASTASIVGNTESVELPTSNYYTRSVLAGQYPVVNYYMVKELQDLGRWNRDTYNNIVDNDGSVQFLPDPDGSLTRFKQKYLTMWEVPQMVMVNLAAQRQICIDHSQSLNIFIKKPNPEMMAKIHRYIEEIGLKSVYYLRSESTNKALQVGGKKVIDSLMKVEKVDRLDNLVKETKEKQNKANILQQEQVISESLLSASKPMLCTREAGCLSCE